jgi:hypothetical protein
MDDAGAMDDTDTDGKAPADGDEEASRGPLRQERDETTG